jgi:hypothetical protein
MATLTPITDAEVDALLAAPPGSVGHALADRRLTVAQALRVADHERAAFPVGRIDADVHGYFDPEDAAAPLKILLERTFVEGRENFRLCTRIACVIDGEQGAFIVPPDPNAFSTDLTSVPRLFTWLVPPTGEHLPAALVHDGMVLDRDARTTYLGPEVDRATADRMFRDGMGVLGTSWIRRWIVWAAVAVATAWSHPNFARRWLWRIVITLTALAIVALGGLATVDYFDCRDVLPWMGELPWWRELLQGGAMAIAIPVVIALLFWWGQARAGMIFGIALAFLLHVTLALVVLLSLFTLVEAVPQKRVGRILMALGGVLVAGVVPIGLLWWACH